LPIGPLELASLLAGMLGAHYVLWLASLLAGMAAFAASRSHRGPKPGPSAVGCRWPPSRPTEDERQRAEDERDAVPWAGIIRSPVCWAESFIMNHLLLDQFSALLRSKF